MISLAGCGEGAAGLAAIVNRAFDLVTALVKFSFVMDRRPGCVEVDGDLVSLDRALDRGLAQRSRVGAGQLVAILLQDERRCSALVAQLDRGIPGTGQISGKQC